MNNNLIEVLDKNGNYSRYSEGYIGFFGYILYHCDCDYECDCDYDEILSHIFFDKNKEFKGVVVDEHSVDYEDIIPDILAEKQDDIDNINNYSILFHSYMEDGIRVEKEISK